MGSHLISYAFHLVDFEHIFFSSLNIIPKEDFYPLYDVPITFYLLL